MTWMKLMRKLALLFLAANVAILPGIAQADTPNEFESITLLKTMASDYLHSLIKKPENTSLSITVGNIDPRLSLKKCPVSKLSCYLPPGNSATTANIVGIRCDSSTPWSVYIPVSTSLTQNVMTSTRPLSAGTLLSSNDFQLSPVNVNKLSNGSVTDPTQLIGQRLKHAIGPGIPITAHDTELPTMIKRGEQVSIDVTHGLIHVSTSGVALSDGRKGENISVKNISSNRQISALVVAPGKVSVETN